MPLALQLQGVGPGTEWAHLRVFVSLNIRFAAKIPTVAHRSAAAAGAGDRQARRQPANINMPPARLSAPVARLSWWGASGLMGLNHHSFIRRSLN
jgi:hypothetical protein